MTQRWRSECKSHLLTAAWLQGVWLNVYRTPEARGAGAGKHQRPLQGHSASCAGLCSHKLIVTNWQIRGRGENLGQNPPRVSEAYCPKSETQLS